MSSANTIGRREAIKRVAFLLGGAISAPAAAGVLQGCSASTEQGQALQTLNAAQNRQVVMISEMIIPATDTPGAKAAKVHLFIDKMLTEWYSEEEKARFLKGLQEVDRRANNQYGQRFVDASEEQRTTLLTQLDEEAYNEEAEGTPFFRTMKELTLLGYYTSEIGMTEELQWIAAPGRYDGCVPLEEVGNGRTWA